MYTSVYSNLHNATSWNGMQLQEFDTFLATEVASRLYDAVGKADFTSHLSSLASTGFAQDSLQAILEAEHPEERVLVLNRNVRFFAELKRPFFQPWSRVKGGR